MNHRTCLTPFLLILTLLYSGCCRPKSTDASLIARNTGAPIDPGSLPSLDPRKRLDIATGFERMLEEQRALVARAEAAANKAAQNPPGAPIDAPVHGVPAPVAVTEFPPLPTLAEVPRPALFTSLGNPDAIASMTAPMPATPTPSADTSVRVIYDLVPAVGGSPLRPVAPRIEPPGAAHGLRFQVAGQTPLPGWMRINSRTGAISSAGPVPASVGTAGYLVNVFRNGTKIAESSVAVAPLQ